jgi:uncharacterized protein YdeI (YjbR/CyaY-like superfamily)
MFTKKSGVEHYVKGSEALDVALCYGWITGQARPHDSISCLWRFCPRRPKSIWSKLNTGHADGLVKEGRMKPAGLLQIEEAKRDGRWARAYSSPRTATVPTDFLKALNRNRKARSFFKTLNKGNTYAIVFRIENAKSEEKRSKKIAELVRMLEEGRTFH